MSMTELPRKAVQRTARLAALPLGYAGRSALGFGRRLGGAPADAVMSELQQRTAEQLFRTLGDLKGGAMKFGQALSIFESALPDELAAPYREHLTRLQDSAPPMPTITVREILARELGAAWKAQLVDFDAEPAAAASIGQVHRGTWVDGREVAVKVQYPGAGDALRSDLRTLARFARSMAPLFPALDIRAVVDELQERVVEELDYLLEAEAQRAFAAEYAEDPEWVVPPVVAGSSTVLVTEWMESPYSLAQVIRSGTREERDHYGRLFIRFLFSAPARTGLLHADPHPGNFRILPAPDGGLGRLGVLDFGAVARLPERSLPPTVGHLVRLAAQDDYEQVIEVGRREGFILDRVQVDQQALRNYLAPLIEPLAAEEFTFTRAWMQEQFRRVQDPRSEDYKTMLRLNLPPSYLLLHRTWTGGVGVLAQLGATVNFRDLLTETLPGFAE